MNLRELVSHYLLSLQERGVTCLPVDDSARAILRDWMLAARSGAALPARPAIVAPATGVVTTPAAATAAPQAAEAFQPLPATRGEGVSGTGDAVPSPDSPPAVRRQVSLLEEVEAEQEAASTPLPGEDEEPLPFFRPAGASPQEQWESFAAMLPRWKPLRDLGTLREKAVPGQGSRNASIMFVGDAPGVPDERAGLPFQGEAGAKLDGMLRAMGLTRDEVYITHLVKFRPAMPRQTLNNRPPTPKEVALSLPVLTCEVQLVQPRVIVALGVVAARGLLGCGELPLAACQSIRGHCCGVPVVVTHHPSYLLRTSDVKERRRLWEEMMRVMEMAGLPISEKQRNYFLPRAS